MANTISLNKDAIANYNSTIEEAILMLCIHNNLDFTEAEKSLINKGLVTAERDENYQPVGWRLTRNGQQLLESIILDSDTHKQPEERIASLAESLMEVFPKLKKSGTSRYFRGNAKDVALKLKKFFKFYGNKYTDEQIINAAKNYVESFNGNYTYMRILEYFIWKDERKLNEEGNIYIEKTSDLATWIENAGQEDALNDDWGVTLR